IVKGDGIVAAPGGNVCCCDIRKKNLPQPVTLAAPAAERVGIGIAIQMIIDVEGIAGGTTYGADNVNRFGETVEVSVAEPDGVVAALAEDIQLQWHWI